MWPVDVMSRARHGGGGATAGRRCPDAPVLQNAWATPGVGCRDQFWGRVDGAVYAGAGSWAPTYRTLPAQRWRRRPRIAKRRSAPAACSDCGLRSRSVVRAAATFGFAAFVGGGGMGGGKSCGRTAADSLGEHESGAGWRRHRLAASTGREPHGLVALCVAVVCVLHGRQPRRAGSVRTWGRRGDLGITASLGLTAGVSSLARRACGSEGGPSGTLFGVGIAYALGRR